ncbi:MULTISPECIES: serine/threonine-protein kinase [unclassified Variovorax]|uniref:serine/threonine protein kinase n=1 Tax=unclassified Variovorax TaxID=663243 RepID=UPI002B239674|nr:MULTISPECIES: serine/threonine-protein kinase [unclassified Variovorax]MEB0059134.1 serine/threonine-protein kinase [Variovorax sp. LG9.2]MEB0112865.1 serine/threonine-protein kinase [Variovorax sp. RTB1]
MTSTRHRIEENGAGAAALAESTKPFEYEITGLIAEGDFGIVYLAFDPSSRERIAIREYLPAALAARSAASPAVVVKSERHVDLYQSGLRSFINEARTLARFDHPAVVKVLRWWEANDTAYMAMPYYEGPTLAQWLADLGHAPDEKQLLDLLHPLLAGLSAMHAVRCLHRDVAPEKIIVSRSGPVLLDLGAARRVIGNIAQTPNAARQLGFASIEQYGEAPSMKQGPWTDLYALAGVVYAAVTGERPMAAIERLMEDRLVSISERAKGRYGMPFLAAIDNALALRPQDRTQTAEAFWAQLNGRETETPSTNSGSSSDNNGTYPTYPAPLEPVEQGAWQSTAETRLDLSEMDPLWSSDAALSATSRGGVRRQGSARYFVVAALCVALVAAVIGGAMFQARHADAEARSALGQKQALKLRQMREAVTRTHTEVSPLPGLPAQAAPPAPSATTRLATESKASTLPEPMVIFSMASTASAKAKAVAASATAHPTVASRSRCSELLQSASLGPLRAGDTSLLKSECRS